MGLRASRPAVAGRANVRNSAARSTCSASTASIRTTNLPDPAAITAGLTARHCAWAGSSWRAGAPHPQSLVTARLPVPSRRCPSAGQPRAARKLSARSPPWPTAATFGRDASGRSDHKVSGVTQAAAPTTRSPCIRRQCARHQLAAALQIVTRLSRGETPDRFWRQADDLPRGG